MANNTSAKLVLGRRHQPGPDQVPTFTLDAAQLQQHTLVLGQSGSGKSFFLTRLIEEIVLRTQARVLVLDPNGDYQRLPELNEKVFVKHKADFQRADRDSSELRIQSLDIDTAFAAEWEERRFRILSFQKTGDGLPSSTKSVACAHIWLSWSEILESHDFLLDFASPSNPLSNKLRNGLSACYRHAKHAASPGTSDGRFGLTELLDSAKQFKDGNVKLDDFPEARDIDRSEWPDLIAIISRLLSRFSSWYDHSPKDSPEIRRHLEVPFRQPPTDAWDALVLCLNRSTSTLDSLLVAETTLRSIWELSKERWEVSFSAQHPIGNPAPTFVVVDEAHNFAPKEITNELRARVRDRLMQIAAEGRKYGIYLILGTQRPRKLHDGLTLECENYALMRVQSQEELRFAEENFGLKNCAMVQSVPSFGVGTALMSGRWVQGIEQIHVVPARTRVSGGNPDVAWMSRPLLGGSLDAESLKQLLKRHNGIVKMEQAGEVFGEVRIGKRLFTDLTDVEQTRLLENLSTENQDLVFAQFVRSQGSTWQIVYMPEYQRQLGSHVNKRATKGSSPRDWACVVVRKTVENNGPVFLSMMGELLIDASRKVIPMVDVTGWFGHNTLRRFIESIGGLSIGYAQNGAEMVFDPTKDQLALISPSPIVRPSVFAEPTMQDVFERALSNGFELPNVKSGIVARVISLFGRFCGQFVAEDGVFDLAGVKAAVRLAIEQDAGVVTGRDMWYMTTNLMRIGRKLGRDFDAVASLAAYENWLLDRLTSICGLSPEEEVLVRQWVHGSSSFSAE